MANEYTKVCPECRMSSGMNFPLSKKEDVLVCSKNPLHRFKMDKEGFLRSV